MSSSFRPPGHLVSVLAVLLLSHFTASMCLSTSCLCLPFPSHSPNFCTAFSSVALLIYLFSFALCTHQHPILIPHSPHITFCLCPSFLTMWTPELKHQGHALLHSLPRQGKKVFLHTQSFALLLCILKHSRAWSCWFFSFIHSSDIHFSTIP